MIFSQRNAKDQWMGKPIVCQNSRMRRIRSDVCRAILVTSIFWLLLDVIILFYFLDTFAITSERRTLIRSAKFGKSSATSDDSQNIEFSSEHSEQLNKLLSKLSFAATGPGQDGAGVSIPKEKEEEMKEMFKINQFNLMASDMISINRSLPDYRSEGCKAKGEEIKHHNLPSVSIIIVFHNEAFSTLLRTLHSVINRSPLNLLTEIILIDDLSERGSIKFIQSYVSSVLVHLDYLKEPLEMYIKRFPLPIHLVHLKERSGLIRARLTGSAMAKGTILLFLDAHVEVTEGWLEPLVDRVLADRKCVVAPIIDVISDDTFEYVTASDTTWGGFNWHLNFRWYPVPDREMKRRNWDRSLPIRTPTIAGGLFAIDRQFFYDIGSYDRGMKVWGGENLEISFRVWTCGGTLEIHPCSRVGHVFRKQTPYTFPGGTATVIHHNAKRTAEVWMDDYKHFFYAISPAASNVDAGDLTERRELRTTLQCKSFQWYLENIYLEAPIPSKYYSIGQIMNRDTRMCIDTMGRKSGQEAGISQCHGLGGNQAWSLTGSGEIRSDELCLTTKNFKSREIQLDKCSTTTVNKKQLFHYDVKTKRIIHKDSGACLIVENDNLELIICDDFSRNTVWVIENYHNLLPSSDAFDDVAPLDGAPRS